MKKVRWNIYKRTNTHVEMMNMDNGVIRKVALASDKQWKFLESLRAEMTNRPPLKNRPFAHDAKKQIDKLLTKKENIEKQQTLL